MAPTENIGDRASKAFRRNTLNYGFKARYEATGKTNFDREYHRDSLEATKHVSCAVGRSRRRTARERISRYADGQRRHRPLGNGSRQCEFVCDVDTHQLRTIQRRNTVHRYPGPRNVAAQFQFDHSTGTVSSEFELLNYDNATNTRIQIYRNQVGIDATLSPLLSFRGNIGAINLITEGGVNPLAATGANGLGCVNVELASRLDWRRGSDLQNAQEHDAYV